jgi:hypothetical protein
MLLLQITFVTGEPLKILDPTPEDICRAVEGCCFGHNDEIILLARADDDWVESDGETAIHFRQGGSGIFIYEGPIDYTTLLGVFLRYARNEETWKMDFQLRWEDRGL